MKLQTQELISKLTPEGAERLAMLEMLLSGEVLNLHAPMMTMSAERVSSPVELDLSSRKNLCSQILSALAGISYPTPEETYGTNIEWAVSDVLRVLHKEGEWREGLAKQIRDALVACSIRPIEQDYGEDLGTAVKDISLALVANDQAQTTFAKKWNVPRVGDKVRLLKMNETVPTDKFRVGGIYEVDSLSTWSDPKPSNDPDHWKKAMRFAVCLKEETNASGWMWPIESVELV